MTLPQFISSRAVHTLAIAVLVDGENLTAGHSAAVLAQARSMGEVRFRRVYGNACVIGGWTEQAGFGVVHTASGKNSADIRLAIDAVDLALTKQVRRFLIVSSDSDFAHVVDYLREQGAFVCGMGEQSTPPRFRAACDQFHGLEPAAKVACKNKAGRKSLQQLLVDHLAAQPGNKGVRIADLNPVMLREHDIRIGQLPEKNWRAFLTRRAGIFLCDPRGPDARVRLRNPSNT
ncbi:NYN domain-containing protein [Sedimentitalea sp. HM32M-2]|uniref:NYN domain-containing protein n=1 Tax=Sedimentitalea sp. HM32M-2 TaxID=3351566 RepID=UPI00362CCF4B